VRRLVALVVLSVAACSSGGGGGTPLPSTGGATGGGTRTAAPPSAVGPFDAEYATDPRSPVTWLVEPTGKAEDDEILAAYRHFVFMIHRVAAQPDPEDPELLALTRGAARAFYTRQYAESVRDHVTQSGPGTVKAATVRHLGRAVAVAACVDQRQSYVYEDGQRDPEPIGFYRETAVLQQVDGKWVAIQVTGQLKAC
jgi:hypothetical protein